MPMGISSGGGGGGGGGVSKGEATLNPMYSTTSAGLAQRQEQIIRQQDQQLGVLSEGIDRLKDKAGAIGQEVKYQGKLLDDLEENVETGIIGLQNEDAHAARVREKSQTFYMYCCVALETLVLCILLFVAFIK